MKYTEAIRKVTKDNAGKDFNRKDFVNVEIIKDNVSLREKDEQGKPIVLHAKGEKVKLHRFDADAYVLMGIGKITK